MSAAVPGGAQHGRRTGGEHLRQPTLLFDLERHRWRLLAGEWVADFRQPLCQPGSGGGGGSPYAFQINPVLGVAYVADDRTIANGGGILKYTNNAVAGPAPIPWAPRPVRPLHTARVA